MPAIYAVDHMAAEEGSRRQHLREWVAAGQAIVAVVDDVVAGYAALDYTFFGCGFIAVLMVKPESRRKGVATALVAQLEGCCQTEKLFTSTNESNKSMQAFMQAMSFEPSGTVYNNVMYQALPSSMGASFAIVQMVREGSITLALSHQVLLEYEEVLTRPASLRAFDLTRSDVGAVLRFAAYVSEKFEPRFLFRPNLRDETDSIFVELAVVSRSEYLITQNIRDYRDGELKFESFRAVTPATFLTEWRG